MADVVLVPEATSHTPGPWKASQLETGHWWIARADEYRSIASLIAYPEDAANARLIAAAPELLAALEELYALVRGECPSLLNEDSGGSALLDMRVSAAIAKAKS